jgi:hypothetical protein
LLQRLGVAAVRTQNGTEHRQSVRLAGPPSDAASCAQGLVSLGQRMVADAVMM